MRNPNQDVDGASASTSAQVDYGERRLRPSQPGCSTSSSAHHSDHLQYQAAAAAAAPGQAAGSTTAAGTTGFPPMKPQPNNPYRDIPVDRLEARLEDYDDDDELDSMSDQNKVSLHSICSCQHFTDLELRLRIQDESLIGASSFLSLASFHPFKYGL